MQTVGKDMVAKVALESLVSAEKGNMSYDDFQAQQLAGNNELISIICVVLSKCQFLTLDRKIILVKVDILDGNFIAYFRYECV